MGLPSWLADPIGVIWAFGVISFIYFAVKWRNENKAKNDAKMDRLSKNRLSDDHKARHPRPKVPGNGGFRLVVMAGILAVVLRVVISLGIVVSPRLVAWDDGILIVVLALTVMALIGYLLVYPPSADDRPPVATALPLTLVGALRLAAIRFPGLHATPAELESVRDLIRDQVGDAVRLAAKAKRIEQLDDAVQALAQRIEGVIADNGGVLPQGVSVESSWDDRPEGGVTAQFRLRAGVGVVNASLATVWRKVVDSDSLAHTLGQSRSRVAIDPDTLAITVIIGGAEPPAPAPVPEKKAEGGDEPQVEIDDETPLAVGRPPLSVLPTGKHVVGHPDEGKTLRREVESALADLDVPGAVVEDVKVGPAFVTLYVRPPQGSKPSSILSLIKSDDLAAVLGVSAVRQAQSTRPKCVALQIQRKHREIVALRSVLASREFREAVRTMELPLVLGVTPDGGIVVADLARMPHLLVGGMPGGGKSSLLHSLILALVLAHSSKQVRLLMSDPKGNELPRYDGIPHMLAPTALKAPAMIAQIPWLIEEMERRYDLFNRAGGIQDLKRYNNLPGVERLPYVVVVYDEMASLMYHAKAAGKTDNGVKQIDLLNGQLADLLARSRASGIHVIVATQRPSAEVLPGSIQGNIDPRVAMRVRNHIDSGIILGEKGAEKLVAKGDVLLRLEGQLGLLNAQTPFVDGEDLAPVIKALRNEGDPEYDPALMDLLREAGMRVDLSHRADAEDGDDEGAGADEGDADDGEEDDGQEDDGRTGADGDDWHPGD